MAEPIHVKICGITNLADGRYAAAAGADYLGFVQVPTSPRYVPAAEAGEIIAWLHGPDTVGVFADADPDSVNADARTAGFDLVQLHGTESPDVCRAIERPVIKTLHVGPDTTPESLARAAAAYVGAADFLLLDTGTSGGSGRTFDWSVIGPLPLPFFLAGGLTPQNVGGAVSRTRPYAVDVASGVEESPGRKDFERIDAFIRAARGD